MYIYLLGLVVPVGKGMQHTHASAFKLKLIYGQVGISLKLVEERPGAGFSCSLTAELYAVEVHQVEDITHLNLTQIHGERVGCVLRGNTIHDDMLTSVLNREVVYQQELIAIQHIRRLYIPTLATQDDVRRHESQVCLLLACHVVVQLHDAVQLATHALALVVVVPVERCGKIVVGSMGRESQIQMLAVVHLLTYVQVTTHGVGWRRDVDVAIAIPRAVVGKRWDVAVQV